MYPIKEANKLISNGTHKWCVGHLDAVPIATMSIDDRYCQACYDLLQGEASLLAQSGDRRKRNWPPVIV